MRTRERIPPSQRVEKNLSVNKTATFYRSKMPVQQIEFTRVKNKSVENNRKKYRNNSASKNTIKLEDKKFDLEGEMQKSRERQILIIRRNVALWKYYNSLIALFMITYTSSQVLVSNFFQVKRKGYFFPEVPGQPGVNLIGLLLKVYETVKNIQYENKITKLATNILRMAPTPSIFEKKIEFISRKVVLNRQKSKQIQLSFIDLQLQTFWQMLIDRITISSQVQFIQDMFELQPEKLCVKDFQLLIDQYLCKQDFELDLKHTSGFYQENYGVNAQTHQFDVQFLIIEKLCTSDFEREISYTKEEVKITKKSCQIF